VPLPAKPVVLGRVIGAHGVRGQVRVSYFGDGPHRLLSASELWLARSEHDPGAQRFEVSASGNARPGEVRLTLSGVSDRDAAQALRGELVMADPSVLDELPEGEFYWHDLVGCQVEDMQGTRIGTVVEIWETGAHDLLVVESDSGARHLLPTARELMPEIDVAANRIVVDPPPGFFDPA